MTEYICHRNNDFYILIALTWLLGCRHTPSNKFWNIVSTAQEAESCMLEIAVFKNPVMIFQVL